MKILAKTVLMLSLVAAVPVFIAKQNSDLFLEASRLQATRILISPDLLRQFDLSSICLNQKIDRFDYDNFLFGFHQITYFTVNEKCRIVLRGEFRNSIFNKISDLTIYGYGSSSGEPIILKNFE